MARVRIESVPVQNFKLGWLGFHHLQLVLEQDETDIRQKQDYWYVIEGVRDDSLSPIQLGVMGAEGNLSLAAANGGLFDEELVAAIGTPEQRGSRAFSSLQDGWASWQTIAHYAQEIDAQEFPYFAFSLTDSPRAMFNSSSVIASLLYYAGLDPSISMPSRLGWSPGTTTLLGTPERDHMKIEYRFNTLAGGWGSDILEGADNAGFTDKLYGGQDDDLFYWSTGFNIIHGGHTGLAYAEDGLDVVDYSGIGEVTINLNKYNADHLLPKYIATSERGLDWLFSIERVRWDSKTDVVNLGRGVVGLEDDLRFDLGPEGDGYGDKISFSDAPDALQVLAAADGLTFVQGRTAQTEKGLWIDSLEWLAGSAGSDVIYGGEGLDRIDGAAGNDLIDARLAAAFTSDSPLGFDVEIAGGDGDDTLVSGQGKTLARGDGGADRFVLSAMSTVGGPTVEYVIADADADDRLFAPLAFFDGAGGVYEQSELLPILGALGTYDELVEFGSLYFTATLQSTLLYGSDLTQGVIPFLGMIEFMLDGNDLLVNVARGFAETSVYPKDGGGSYTKIENVIDIDTMATIRVRDYTYGDLGIVFHDLGEPDSVVTEPGRVATAYPNWDSAVRAITNNGVMTAPLDARPEAPDYEDPADPANRPETVHGGGGDDVIVVLAKSDVHAGGGDDDVTGSSRDDVIDGGTGDDTMRGGRGDDRYHVDSAADTILEAPGEGVDTVVATVDIAALAPHIEHLRLAGGALRGVGNEAANRITGTDGDNLLEGQAGDDTLHGGAGSDVLIGGAGADGYLYEVGDGDETIIDAGAAADDDTLVLVGVASSDVSFFRGADGRDLNVQIAHGGRLVIRDYAATGQGIDVLMFAAGETWDRARILAAGAAAPAPTNDPPQAVSDFGALARGHAFTIPAEALLANDRSYDGDPLAIVAVAGVSAGVATIDSDGNIAVVLPAGFEDELVFTYTIADGNGGTSSATARIGVLANAAPLAATPLATQTLTAGAAWSYAVPVGAFTDPDGDPLTFSARLSNGDALPAWLSFDAATRTFSGTAPEGITAALSLTVTATDGAATAATALLLQITAPQVGRTFVGTGGADRFTGTEGNDVFTVTGDGGLDTIDGRGGFDRIQGSSFNDVIRVASAPVNLTGIEAIDGGAGYDSIRGTFEADTIDLSAMTITNVEVIDGLAGDDVIVGTAGADIITGNTGHDVLEGGAGDDVFLVAGDGGSDRIDGGDGFDSVRASTYNDVIRFFGDRSLRNVEFIDGGDGTNDKLMGSAGDDVLDLSQTRVVGIEVIDGGSGNDQIIGTGGADYIYGGVGNDQLSGGAGDDTFALAGDGGFDVIDGGGGYDRQAGSSYDDVFRVTSGLTSWTNLEAVDGGAGVDRILATAANDELDFSAIALASVERIDAGAGNDRLSGSRGDDVLAGGSGLDTFVFRPGSGNDVIVDFQLGSATGSGRELVDLAAFGFAGFAELRAQAVQLDTGTRIDLGPGTSLTLANVRLDDLTAGHFLLL